MNPNQQEDSLLGELKEDLQKILSQRVDSEVESEKQRQYLRLEKADNYYRGQQHIAQEWDSTTGTMGWSSVGSPQIGRDISDQSELYDYNVDIVKSYGRKYFSVLGTRPFHNAKSLPDDPQSEEDRKAARQAELVAINLKTKWNIRVRNIEVFYGQWKAGNVYAYVDHVANKQLFGERTEPIIEEQPQEIEPAGFRCPSCATKFGQPVSDVDPVTGLPVQSCPNCGAPISDYNFEEAETAMVPQEVGQQNFVNAGPTLELCTGYTVTLPFDTKALDYRAPWLNYEYDEHPGALLQIYRKELASKLDDNGDLKPAGDSQVTEQGTRVRSEAASLMGVQQTAKQTRWVYGRTWLMPFMYEYVKDEAKRKTLYENFPEGLKISRVGGHVVKIEHESLLESWGVFQPEPGDYLYSDPMCWGILGHQDIINDSWNMMIAILERVMPSGFFDPDVIDPQSMNDRNHLCEWLPAKAGVGGRLESAITKAPTASFPDHAFPMMQGLEQNVQSYTGIQPAVFGGGEKSATAEEARTKLNQALMQLGVPGEYAGQGWKTVLDLAVGKVKKYGLYAGAIATGKDTSEMFDLEALRAGNCHFESDPGVPMSYAERRDQLNLIIGQNPALASALGLDNPINVPVVRDYLLPGMPELLVPGEDRRNKTIEVIRELLKQQPVGDQSSILPEPFVDDPMDAALVLDWLRSEPGRRVAVDNPGGRANVIAYGKSMAMLPPTMGTPPPPPLPPPKGGGKQAGPPPPPDGDPGAQPAPMM